MIMPWPAAIMIVAPLAGLLSDRYPAGVLGALGMFIAAGGFVLLAMLPVDASHTAIVWRIALDSPHSVFSSVMHEYFTVSREAVFDNYRIFTLFTSAKTSNRVCNGS